IKQMNRDDERVSVHERCDESFSTCKYRCASGLLYKMNDVCALLVWLLNSNEAELASVLRRTRAIASICAAHLSAKLKIKFWPSARVESLYPIVYPIYMLASVTCRATQINRPKQNELLPAADLRAALQARPHSYNWTLINVLGAPEPAHINFPESCLRISIIIACNESVQRVELELSGAFWVLGCGFGELGTRNPKSYVPPRDVMMRFDATAGCRLHQRRACRSIQTRARLRSSSRTREAVEDAPDALHARESYGLLLHIISLLLLMPLLPFMCKHNESQVLETTRRKQIFSGPSCAGCMINFSQVVRRFWTFVWGELVWDRNIRYRNDAICGPCTHIKRPTRNSSSRYGHR
ncbi:unnamed protein product, partial [Trichogramma brassicae]